MYPPRNENHPLILITTLLIRKRQQRYRQPQMRIRQRLYIQTILTTLLHHLNHLQHITISERIHQTELILHLG